MIFVSWGDRQPSPNRSETVSGKLKFSFAGKLASCWTPYKWKKVSSFTSSTWPKCAKVSKKAWKSALCDVPMSADTSLMAHSALEFYFSLLRFFVVAALLSHSIVMGLLGSVPQHNQCILHPMACGKQVMLHPCPAQSFSLQEFMTLWGLSPLCPVVLFAFETVNQTKPVADAKWQGSLKIIDIAKPCC